MFPLNFLFQLSLSLSQGKCSISFLNLHENILKEWKDPIKAIFLDLVINTHTIAEGFFFKKKLLSIRDILSNLNDKLVKVLQYMCGGFGFFFFSF